MATTWTLTLWSKGVWTSGAAQRTRDPQHRWHRAGQRGQDARPPGEGLTSGPQFPLTIIVTPRRRSSWKVNDFMCIKCREQRPAHSNVRKFFPSLTV